MAIRYLKNILMYIYESKLIKTKIIQINLNKQYGVKDYDEIVLFSTFRSEVSDDDSYLYFEYQENHFCEVREYKSYFKKIMEGFISIFKSNKNQKEDYISIKGEEDDIENPLQNEEDEENEENEENKENKDGIHLKTE
jgi:hypothetical protein